MYYFNKIILFLSLSFIFSSPLDFKYGLIGKKSKHSKRFYEINHQDTLSSNFIKLNFKLSNSFFYVFLENASNDFSVLLNVNSNINNFSNEKNQLFTPWINIGSYEDSMKIHLISSQNKLYEIENLINDYSDLNKRNQNKIKKKILILLSELRNESNLHTDQLNNRLEDQIMTGVTFRATQKTRLVEQSILKEVNDNLNANVLMKTISLILPK
tara:strand:- start:33 stop:671 length:639 start_codon:yes stop_codon:yes gene_type:complete